MVRFSDFNLADVGVTVQMTGAIYSDAGTHYLCLFPGDHEDLPVEFLPMNQGEWAAFLHQADNVEVEALTRSTDGAVAKAMVRKAQRIVEQGVTWKVFRRDQFRCRYCGADDVPLTVDHLVLWEDGGPSTVENLVSACRKCNKVRGRTPYAEWLRHPHYLHTAARLTPGERQANEAVAATLAAVPRVPVRTR